MPNHRNAPLDALEARLTGPKRIALFGHRGVGKTTLLAMFYRQAASGQVPGLRLAATEPATAEYLAEKIARIESGEPPAGTLAETELQLRLYRGPARLDLIVKDYQGEHVTLGAEEPIQAFFADCDAVLLCLDPEGSAEPAERRRRQQEVEDLLERYIGRSPDGTTGRPVALLLTKFDRVLAQMTGAHDDNPATWGVERVVEAQYGMTRHALAQHVRHGAIFAVSAYGRGSRDGRPPAELHPLGLDAPLGWLADELEAGDREQLEWIWDLAPGDLPRLERCVSAFARRYPQSDQTAHYQRRLGVLRRRRNARRWWRLALAAAVVLGALAGYDAWGFQEAVGFERDHAAPAVAARWSGLLAWHPSLPWFWPGWAREARRRQAEWAVKAAETQVALGTAGPDLPERLTRLKDEAPELAPAIRKVEEARREARHGERWAAVRADAMAPTDDPEVPLLAMRGFLRDYPDTPHRREAMDLVQALKVRADERKGQVERRLLDDLTRSETLPNADFRDLIDRAQQFLADHPESAWRGEVTRRLDDYVRRLDERGIDRARQYSKQYPSHFATRIERYQDYLKAHQAGGRFISEATEAKDRILREWDDYAYRLAYDHLQAHPDDVADVARRLRDYQRDHRDGRHGAEARRFLAWWDKVSIPGQYRVTLRRGEVEPTVGKYLGGGGPDLGVEIEVGGVMYGPSPVVRNTHRPIWDYTFPRPIAWKSGDPVTIRIIDYDWSDTVVFTLSSPKGDPLALRLLSGTVKPSKGGRTTLVFASDFAPPRLAAPE
ncbi:MAG: hypothetical protein P4L84_02860 [Isosphaeraceae bacterium]|nr:hypothetical protein [Isosphaeraceae bacterium]